MTGRDPRIHLVIDEVVLRGVPPEQADDVVAALHQHLAGLAEADRERLLATDGGAAHAVRPHTEHMPVSGAAELGRLAARSVWSGIGTAAGGTP